MSKEIMTKKRLGVDIDGVIADYTKGLKRWAGTLEPGFDVEEHCRSYYLTGRGIPGSHSQFVRAGGLRALEEMPEAVAGLSSLERRGYVLCLITHRSHVSGAEVLEDTVRWLHEHAIPYQELHFLGGRSNKGNVLCDYYLDDSPVVIEALRQRGKKAAIFDNPYNRHCEGARIKRWPEVHTWLRNGQDS